MRNFLQVATRHLHCRIISKETIKPSFPTLPHLKTYNFSLLDQASPSIHMPYVFFYPNYARSSHEYDQQEMRLATSQVLKKSLSQTLSQYYPFSGTYVITAGAENRAYVDCNDEGVEFVEAEIDATLSEQLIHIDSHHENQSLDRFVSMNGVCGPIYKGSSTHLVMVQLSYFACGGLALAVSISHKMADGSSFYNFVNHWAAVTQRNLGRDQRSSLLSDPHFINSPNGHTEAYIPEYVINKGNNLVTKKFVFPNSKLAQLKAKAKGHGHKNASSVDVTMNPNPTRIEVLSSLLYGCAVRAAKKVNSQSIDSFALVLTVNVRNRMIPPFPQTTMGNICLCIDIPTTIAESELALSRLTARLKKAKMQLTGITSLQVNQRLRCLEAVYHEPSMTNSASNAAVVETFFFPSMCGFPLYQVDFGWGKPVRVSMAGFIGKNFFFLMDAPSGDGIEVMLSLEEETMAAFLNDDQLLAFA